MLFLHVYIFIYTYIYINIMWETLDIKKYFINCLLTKHLALSCKSYLGSSLQNTYWYIRGVMGEPSGLYARLGFSLYSGSRIGCTNVIYEPLL